MIYILSIIISVIIFISIFYIQFNILIYITLTLFIINTALTKSVFKTIKRALHLLPYFFAVLILQIINPRGEYYKIFDIYIDKTGFDFTITYFIRILSILYFLSIFFTIIKKMSVPKGKLFDEILRISIFMKIVRKSFFLEFKKIKDKNKDFKQKLNAVKNLIETVYGDSFLHYPYERYIKTYRVSITKTNSRFFTY